MLDHVAVGVADLERAARFYEAALAPLGLTKLIVRPATVGFGKSYPEFWINLRPGMQRVSPDSGTHICLRARTTDEVEAFYAAALGGGGTDDGPPGVRPHDRVKYFAAFVADPDGNRIEAVTFLKDDQPGELGCLQPACDLVVHQLGRFRNLRSDLLKRRENVLDAISGQNIDPQIGADECRLLHVIDQSEQGIPEALDIGEQDRLAVAAELRPRHLFDQLFQGADAAGKRDERVGVLEHQLLALVHVLGDDELLSLFQHMLPFRQEGRDDAGDFAAVLERAGRNGSHQADRAAAIDQTDTIFGKGFAEGCGRFDEFGIGTGAGTAINTDILDSIHIMRCGIALRHRQDAHLAAHSRLFLESRFLRKRTAGQGAKGAGTLYMTPMTPPCDMAARAASGRVRQPQGDRR